MLGLGGRIQKGRRRRVIVLRLRRRNRAHIVLHIWQGILAHKEALAYARILWTIAG